jgi:hypothetical protein
MGKPSVDHAPNAHDDVANAAAGAIVLADRRGRKARPMARGIGGYSLDHWDAKEPTTVPVRNVDDRLPDFIRDW